MTAPTTPVRAALLALLRATDPNAGVLPEGEKLEAVWPIACDLYGQNGLLFEWHDPLMNALDDMLDATPHAVIDVRYIDLARRTAQAALAALPTPPPNTPTEPGPADGFRYATPAQIAVHKAFLDGETAP